MASSEDLRNLAERARESGDSKPLLRYLKERRAMRQTPDDRVAVLTAEIERLRDSNEVLTEQVRRMDAEAEQSEAKAAGLASALDQVASVDVDDNGMDYWIRWAQDLAAQVLAVSGLECVPGWLRVWGDGHLEWYMTKEPPCDLPQDGVKSTVHLASIVYHKEQQHGA